MSRVLQSITFLTGISYSSYAFLAYVCLQTRLLLNIRQRLLHKLFHLRPERSDVPGELLLAAAQDALLLPMGRIRVTSST
jgi:hypothetical protein